MHYQESNEIIQSLENLNSEIREIWEVLNKQQKEGTLRSALPPPPLVYPELGWPPLAGARVPAFRPPYAGAGEQSLVERTRSLREWLRQARIDTADLVSPPQASL
ncbi:Uncharacterized protein GBIM_17739 [Gryllus bimaculatus]|nr:Uncharacterized protein GBIM_17739 [Gryllus bimaculatus]